jgi:apolipoprotein N-acyltransferase
MQKRLEFPGVWALSTVSGCLWFLAVSPFDFSWLAWVAAIPMFAAIERADSMRRALFVGWWAGLVETAGGFYWLIDVMQRFAEFPWIAAAAIFFLFCAARALIFLLFTAVVRDMRRRHRLPMTLLGPMVMAACEFAVPQIFPCGQWISQAWNPHVIQITELTGPPGVTALLMLVNGALYDLYCDRARARIPAAAAAVLLCAALVFGVVRIRQVDAAMQRAPHLAIGLVQPNIAYDANGDVTREEVFRQLAALQAQSQRLEKAGAALTVWSEGSFPLAIPRTFAADLDEESEGMIRRGLHGPVIIGADMVDPKTDQNYNSAVVVDAQGRIGGHYDKVKLLAFGEYIPGIALFPWLRRILPEGAGQFTPGDGPGILPLQTVDGRSWRLGPVICYEDILEGLLRGVGTLHPDLLVNMTSDSWFGAGAEPRQHLALAIFAGVELRVAMVRAVNSGISALIDANGRVTAQTYANDPYREPRPADGILVSAPMMSGGHTVFVAAGNLFAYACLAGTLWCAGMLLRSRRRREMQ